MVHTGMVGTLFLVAVLTLAGCLESSDGPADNPDDPMPIDTGPTALRLAGCMEHFAAVPIPASQLEGRVPAGFTLASLDPAGATGLVAVATWECQETTADGISNAPVTEMVTAIVVEPPPELRSADADFHIVIAGSITTREDLLPIYDAWGIPRDHGSITLETTTLPADAGRVGHVLAEADYTAHVYTTVTGEITTGPASGLRLFGVHDGEVTGIVDVHTSARTMQEGTSHVQSTTDGFPPLFPAAGIAAHYWGDFSFELTRGPPTGYGQHHPGLR